MTTEAQWRWVNADVVYAIHAEQLAVHGGAAGLRDLGLLDSALARPRNLAVYGNPDAAALAAAYAFGIARNHPFIDGNKRTAFVVSVVFLECNDLRFYAEQADVVLTTLALAAGDLGEDEFADWLRQRSTRA
jgi:death on curing protein